MARELSEIINEISAEAATYPEFNTIEANTSNVSFWHYLKKLYGFGVLQLEIILDQFKAEILGALEVDYSVGTKDWYKSVCKEWQYGDDIKLKYNTPYYPTVDPSKQLIKRVSVSDINTGGVKLKIQKLNGTEVAPLSATEISAFSTYIQKRKIAGTLLQIESNTPNILTLNASVVLSKEVYNTSGIRHKDGKYGVLDELRNFVQLAEFNEVIYLSTMDDTLNDKEGIIAFNLTACTIDGVSQTLTSGKLTLPSGYGKINESDAVFNLRMTYELV